MRLVIVIAILLVGLAALCACRSRSRDPEGEIYFDNNATMPMSREVAAALMDAGLKGGNPSASYNSCARCALRRFRNELREAAGAPGYAVIFTSGASESNNLVLRGIVDQYWLRHQSRPHIIISAIEHKTSLECARQLAALGRADYSLLPVNVHGIMDPVILERTLRPNTALVSLMHVNNETGVCNDIVELAKVARARGIPFHSDLAQSFTKIPVRLAPYVSAASISFHKFGGPAGCGALLVAPDLDIQAQICGTQNNGLRGGTENVPGLAAAAVALREARAANPQYVFWLRNHLRAGLAALFPGAVFLDWGPSNVVCVSFPGCCGNLIKAQLNAWNVRVSTGSACNSGAGSARTSHVLEAMGVPASVRHGAIRISLGRRNTIEEVERFLRIAPEAVAAACSISPLAGENCCALI